ncbi:hypothetical protein GCM10023205_78800 [Yinghuangia aomiensis]|uniref:Conserved hypothetical protein CHP02391 domain-containing protein n=1 Tax=Yinghuangia aomiensis TaxID=676205 RepID=A0ABP9IC50_9ACTN
MKAALPLPRRSSVIALSTSVARLIIGGVNINMEWAIAELDVFLDLTIMRSAAAPGVFTTATRTKGSEAQVVESAQVVERILDVVIPDWRSRVPDGRNGRNRWFQHNEAARRAKVALQREAEVRANLGDNAPRLNASHLHPWVWEAAKGLWANRHYREAVRTAAVSVNAELQDKVGRKDIGEKDLINQVIRTDPPQPNKPRLHVISDDGSPTFTSMQEGVRAFGEGCFRAIRNPISHNNLPELTEDEGLEQLAAFSVLARWIDGATVHTIP